MRDDDLTGEGDETQVKDEGRDGLDEWVDELDRLIGVEQMSDEEIAEREAARKEEKGTGAVKFIIIAIIILILLALLLYLKII
jgi:cobalamin biosynthesis Mg chelatase CobN